MGEYAVLNGSEVKIGTCEDMYYLRWDQRHAVRAQSGNVDPVRDAASVRFRFPFPDEDGKRPGDFDDHDRGVVVWGATVPEGVEHSIVQFRADTPGYNVCLPCPEGPDAAHGLTIHRNGFRGPVRIVQQRVWERKLVTVCSCGGCGARYRLPELSDAEPLVVALRAMADRQQRDSDMFAARSQQEPWKDRHAAFLHTIADRVLAGYEMTV